MTRDRLIARIAVLLLASPPVLAAARPAFRDLFNGRNLAGCRIA